MELFAETLDRLSSRRPQRPTPDCDAFLPLVYEYEKIAADTVKRLKRYHEPERQAKLKRDWHRRLAGGDETSAQEEPHSAHEREGTTTVDDLLKWEQEQQTWKLLRLLLEVHYPPSTEVDEEGRFVRPSHGKPLHRYSSELDLWKSFLAENHQIWEKYVVVEWLKESADGSGQEIDTIIEQLQEGAERGTGLTSHGWLYSKEAIKGQKRLRSWPAGS